MSWRICRRRLSLAATRHELAVELADREMPSQCVRAVDGDELETCMQAIERRENRIYEWNFCRNLQARMRRKARAYPGDFDLTGLWKVWSIRTFDDRYTAPHHGFNGAEDYYHRASAMRVIDHVARPALILSAADDPRPPHFERVLRPHPHITPSSPVRVHCAFVAIPRPRLPLRPVCGGPVSLEPTATRLLSREDRDRFRVSKGLEPPPRTAEHRGMQGSRQIAGRCMAAIALRGEAMRTPQLEWHSELARRWRPSIRARAPRRRAIDAGPSRSLPGLVRSTSPLNCSRDRMARRAQMRRPLAFPSPGS